MKFQLYDPKLWLGLWLSSLAAVSCGLKSDKPKDPASSQIQLTENNGNNSTNGQANLDSEPASPQASSDRETGVQDKETCIPRSQRPKGPQPVAVKIDPAQVELSAVFARNCAGCHGAKGRGNDKFPDITQSSYQNFQYSVRSGRSGIMPAFDEGKYPQDTLDRDFVALTGKEIPVEEPKPCPIDKTGDNPEIVPKLSYQEVYQGPTPKSKNGRFGLDPFVLPYVTCKELPSKNNPLVMERVCVNAGISGSTQEGYRFADFGVCNDIRTQRPYRPIPVQIRSIHSDADADARLADPKFATELKWVTEQIRASGCVCCHDSSVDKRASFWDISKNKVWTDQLDKYAVEVMTGRVDSTALGAYKPSDNFGFDRYHTGLPTTDVPRMQAFFKGLAQDLGTTDEEIKNMPPLADFLASQLREEPKACDKGVGVDAKTGKITWKSKILGNIPLPGFIPGRFIYVLTEDAQMPLVTPNLDKPKGTLWRLDASSFYRGFTSGKVVYGKVPENAEQTIPDPARFSVQALEKGKTYRLVVQLDVAFPLTNCLFTYGE